MCVIIACNKKRASKGWVQKAFKTNPHGAGGAWVKKGKVYYSKGLNLAQITALNACLPLPYVLHFRIATVGGENKKLCHPFPVTKEARTKTTGRANKVLFHNGHWGAWKEVMMNSLAKIGRIPGGDFSDTRAMAILTATYGEAFLKLLGEKTVILDNEKNMTFFGSWYERDGFWLSNEHFLNTWPDYDSPACGSKWSRTPYKTLAEWEKGLDPKTKKYIQEGNSIRPLITGEKSAEEIAEQASKGEGPKLSSPEFQSDFCKMCWNFKEECQCRDNINIAPEDIQPKNLMIPGIEKNL